jgi:hypothetical protein
MLDDTAVAFAVIAELMRDVTAAMRSALVVWPHDPKDGEIGAAPVLGKYRRVGIAYDSS